MSRYDWSRAANSIENLHFSDEHLRKSIAGRAYRIGQETAYYILTIKRFLDSDKKGPYLYQVIVLENHMKIGEYTLEKPGSKQLLTPAKKKGVEILLEYDPMVEMENVTMVHYKQDRLKDTPWEKEPKANFKAVWSDMEIARLRTLVEYDLEREESQNASAYKEGEAKQYYGNRYERKAINRLNAIRIHGTRCKVCEFDFGEVYGAHGKDFIEVHHIRPLSTLEESVEIDAENDLVPVCSNCHRMLHRSKDRVLTIEELKEILKSNQEM